MESALFLVPEEGIGHPDLFSIRHRQIFDLGWKKKKEKEEGDERIMQYYRSSNNNITNTKKWKYE